MAARRYEISLQVLKHISLVRCAHSWNAFQHEKRNFVSPSGRVIFYLLYKHQWFHGRHPKAQFSFETIATAIFSRVKISCFRAKAHLVFHWCFCNKYQIHHGFKTERERRFCLSAWVEAVAQRYTPWLCLIPSCTLKNQKVKSNIILKHTMTTRRRLAFINLTSTIISCVASMALTHVVVDLINASSFENIDGNRFQLSVIRCYWLKIH